MSSDDRERREEPEAPSSSGSDPSDKGPAESDAAGEATDRPAEGGGAEAGPGGESGADDRAADKADESVPAGEPAEEPAEESATAEQPPKETGTESTPSTYYDDPYEEYEYDYQEPTTSGESETTAVAEAAPQPQVPPPPPPPPTDTEDEEEDDEEGMARMSFLEHLDELRTRILHTLYGLLVAYAGCLAFAQRLFAWMRGPFDRAVEDLPPEANVQLIAITPVEQFHLLYIKIPLVAAVFVAAPWLMYQAWAFIAPGLYKRERHWAGPFVLSTAGLFILGGVFGYYVALRFAFTFLLGLGSDVGIQPLISINSYFNTFVSILLGLGVVFQLPIVIFFLTLLRIVRPGFLLTNVRYAILAIFVVAAIITPTPDVFNMIIFAAPMILLFYVGIGASYLLLWHREKRSIPWRRIMLLAAILLLLALAGMYYLYAELGYRFIRESPWIIRLS